MFQAEREAATENLVFSVVLKILLMTLEYKKGIMNLK